MTKLNEDEEAVAKIEQEIEGTPGDTYARTLVILY